MDRLVAWLASIDNADFSAYEILSFVCWVAFIVASLAYQWSGKALGPEKIDRMFEAMFRGFRAIDHGTPGGFEGANAEVLLCNDGFQPSWRSGEIERLCRTRADPSAAYAYWWIRASIRYIGTKDEKVTWIVEPIDEARAKRQLWIDRKKYKEVFGDEEPV
jgi:hypothetical protein